MGNVFRDGVAIVRVGVPSGCYQGIHLGSKTLSFKGQLSIASSIEMLETAHTAITFKPSNNFVVQQRIRMTNLNMSQICIGNFFTHVFFQISPHKIPQSNNKCVRILG